MVNYKGVYPHNPNMVKHLVFAKKRTFNKGMENKILNGSQIFANKESLKVLMFIWKSIYKVRYEEIHAYTFCSRNKWERMRKQFLEMDLITQKKRAYFCTESQQTKIGNLIHNCYEANSNATE